MNKILSGKELAGFIKERQAKDVVRLKSAHKIIPKLAIVQIKDDLIIDTYVRLKKAYGRDIGIEVESFHPEQSLAIKTIKQLNKDKSIHGIIVQLPITDPSQTDQIVNSVDPSKDVDALAQDTKYDPATPMAILWLLAGYNVDLENKRILLIGKGRLVGAPLMKIFELSGYQVVMADRSTKNLAEQTRQADIIITATGSPAILYSEMIKPGTVIVDAGVASENGKTVGDLASDVYDRDDLILTPPKGGVGPLTVCALFENVIRAAIMVAGKRSV